MRVATALCTVILCAMCMCMTFECGLKLQAVAIAKGGFYSNSHHDTYLAKFLVRTWEETGYIGFHGQFSLQ